jgi:hypothetical protein
MELFKMDESYGMKHCSEAIDGEMSPGSRPPRIDTGRCGVFFFGVLSISV